MQSMRLAYVVLLAAAGFGCGDSGDGTGTGTGGGGTGGASSQATTTTSASGGGTTTGGTGGATAGTGGGVTTGSGGAGDFCTTPPANTAPQIDDQYSAAAMPAMGTATGGTLESGTFYMTAITNYESSATGGTHKDTLVLEVATSTFALVEVNGGTTKPTVAGTFVANGSAFTMQLECPATVSTVVELTYQAGTLTFYDYTSKTVSVWEKQ